MAGGILDSFKGNNLTKLRELARLTYRPSGVKPIKLSKSEVIEPNFIDVKASLLRPFASNLS